MITPVNLIKLTIRKCLGFKEKGQCTENKMGKRFFIFPHFQKFTFPKLITYLSRKSHQTDRNMQTNGKKLN